MADYSLGAAGTIPPAETEDVDAIAAAGANEADNGATD